MFKKPKYVFLSLLLLSIATLPMGCSCGNKSASTSNTNQPGQTGSISGTINVLGSSGLDGVKVVVGDKTTTTNTSGQFSVASVPVGEQTVSFVKDTYYKVSRKVTVQENKDTKVQNIVMKSAQVKHEIQEGSRTIEATISF